jgi:hypothetical protein
VLFLTFCQHPLEQSLDNHRRMAKNTHELIVLPVFGRFFRPNALACGSGNFKSLSGKLRAASMPPGLFWARGIRRSLGLGVFGFRSFDPDQISAAVRRFTSARDLTAGWLGCRLARRTIKRPRESRANFARATSCAHNARIHFARRSRPGGQHFDQSESSAGLVPLLNVPLRQMAVFDFTHLVFFFKLPQRSISIFFAQG